MAKKSAWQEARDYVGRAKDKAYNAGKKVVSDSVQGYRQARDAIAKKIDRDESLPGTQIVRGGVRGGVQRVLNNPSQYNLFSQYTLGKAQQAGDYLYNRINQSKNEGLLGGITAGALGGKKGTHKFVGKAGISAGQSLIGNYKSGFKNLGEGIRERDTKKLGVGIWQSVAPSLAAAGGLAPALGAGLLGGGINSLVAKYRGEDAERAFGEGLFEGFKSRAVTRFTDPKISKAIDAVGGGFLKKQLFQRSIAGFGNAFEDEVISTFDGIKREMPDRALSLLIGMGTAGNSDLIPKTLKTKIGNFLSGKAKSRLTVDQQQKQAKKLVQEADQYIRDYKGRFSKKVKGEMVTPSGGKIDLARPAKWLRTKDGLKRVYADDGEQLGTAFGGFAGLEPYQDEEGKWKVRFDPTKATAGVLVAGGLKNINGRADLQNQVEVPQQTTKQLVSQTNASPLKSDVSGKTSLVDSISDQVIKNDQGKVLTPDIAKGKAADAYLAEEFGQNEFNSSFSKFIGERDASKTLGTKKAEEFAQIPREIAGDVVKFREGSIKDASPEVKKWGEEFKKATDNLFDDAKKNGVPLNYLENYVPHFWQEPVEQVQRAFLSAKSKFKNAKERVLPTYEEGIEMGLTPKFSHPAEILEAYSQGLERTKANVRFLEDLKKQGLLVPASVARNNPGFVPVNAPGIGRNETVLLDKIIEGRWYAPEQVATQINKVFSPDPQNTVGQVLDKTASFSKKLQDLTLSGGIPGTPVNAFTLANIQKELLSGRLSSPLKAFVSSFSNSASTKFFKQNADQILKLQQRNIPLTTSYKVSNLINQKSAKDLFGDGIGGVWNKLMNEPTFSRFMPQLQVRMFNEVESQLLKQGVDGNQAADLAAKAVKNFYGVIGSDKTAKRSKLVTDLASTLTFAPTYRESMVNFWVNTAKSLKRPLAPENINNTKFIIGATLTALVMDQANRAFNGHGMLDNPDGKEDKLLIPLGDGYTIGVPYLTSIATVPRTAAKVGKQLAKLDPQAAVRESRAFLSSAVRPLADVFANEDYFGRPIAETYASGKEKAKAFGGHLLKSYLGHPYIREATELFTKPEKPGYQRLSMAAELPLRFYKTESIENAPFWDEYNRLKKVNERYEGLKYDNPQEAKKLEKDIERYEELKQQVNDFYDLKDLGRKTPKLTLNSDEYTIEDPTPDQLKRFKKQSIEKFISGDKEAATKLRDKYKIQISKQDIDKAKKTKVTDAANLFVEGDSDGAKEMRDKYGLKISKEDIQKAAKRRVKKLYGEGRIEEAIKLRDKYSLKISKKDLGN